MHLLLWVLPTLFFGYSQCSLRERRNPQYFLQGYPYAYSSGLYAPYPPQLGIRPLRPFGSAVCNLVPANNSMVRGRIILEQPSSLGPVELTGEIVGLNPGRHGFHIHEMGDTAGDCIAAGGHFNPSNLDHGAPEDKIRHAGDLGNIVVASNEMAHFRIVDSEISLVEGNPRLIIGRSIVVHEGEDDLGRGGDDGSKKTGNSGSRLACCVIKRPMFYF